MLDTTPTPIEWAQQSVKTNGAKKAFDIAHNNSRSFLDTENVIKNPHAPYWLEASGWIKNRYDITDGTANETVG